MDKTHGIKTTIYIRKDNIEAWEQLESKSGWINDMLSGDEPDLERKIRKIAKEEIQEYISQYGN